MKNPKEQQEQDQTSFLSRPEIKDFLERSMILEKDVEIIERLSHFPSDLIIEELHNLFNGSRGGSGNELELRVRQLEVFLLEHPVDAYEVYKYRRAKELCEAMLSFFRKYGWEKSYILVRILETTVPKRSILQEFSSSQPLQNPHQ